MHLHKKNLKKYIYVINSLQNLISFLIFWGEMFSFSDHSDFVFHNKNLKILLMVYGMVTLKSKYIVLQGVSFFGYHYQKG